MNWIQIIVAALVAMNLTHHMALNKMSQDISNVQFNISSQNKSLTAIFEHLDIMGKIVSDNFGYIKFIKNQTDEIHLRMAAYENTIN